MFPGRDDDHGTAPGSRPKHEQANYADDDDVMNAEIQQASFGQSHNAGLALGCT